MAIEQLGPGVEIIIKNRHEHPKFQVMADIVDLFYYYSFSLMYNVSDKDWTEGLEKFTAFLKETDQKISDIPSVEEKWNEVLADARVKHSDCFPPQSHAA